MAVSETAQIDPWATLGRDVTVALELSGALGRAAHRWTGRFQRGYPKQVIAGRTRDAGHAAEGSGG